MHNVFKYKYMHIFFLHLSNIIKRLKIEYTSKVIDTLSWLCGLNIISRLPLYINVFNEWITEVCIRPAAHVKCLEMTYVVKWD